MMGITSESLRRDRLGGLGDEESLRRDRRGGLGERNRLRSGDGERLV